VSFNFYRPLACPHPDRADVTKLVVDQTAATFEEDKVIIEAHYQNQIRQVPGANIDIHVDAGTNRARRLIAKLSPSTATTA